MPLSQQHRYSSRWWTGSGRSRSLWSGSAAQMRNGSPCNLYEYFRRVDSTRFDPSQFEAVWTLFTSEVESPKWVWRGVANVKHFRSDKHDIELGDGVRIIGRNPARLNSLGFDAAIVHRLMDRWATG